MDILRSWLLGIMAAAMVLSLLYGLLPKGTVRSVSKVTGGLILLLVMLKPLIGTNWTHIEDSYTDYQQEINQQIESYQEDNEKEMARIIQEKTAAYISDKAAQMGLTCQVQVDTGVRDGIPYPAEVTLNIPRDQELSEWMVQELGISEEKQQWQEE